MRALSNFAVYDHDGTVVDENGDLALGDGETSGTATSPTVQLR
ncbi:hypothetical protein [Halobacterium sp. KA-4]|nr:hypothetical protein [Halobacterium sp. KA-4]